MAFRIAEMAQETTTASGTADYGLAGAATNYRAFSDELGAVGPIRTLYCAFDTADPPEYEVGIGTWSTGTPPTITRHVILRSSNNDELVDWQGTGVSKNIVGGLPGKLVEGMLDPDSSGLVRTLAGVTTISPISNAGLSLVSQSTTASMQSYLALVPGTNVQAFDSDLTVLGGLAKTQDYVILASNSTWTSMRMQANLVTNSPTTAVPATEVQTALNQLEHLYAKYAQSTTQNSISPSSNEALTDLDNLAPPSITTGSIYRVSGQVTFSGGAGGDQPQLVNVHVGNAGTTSDPVISWAASAAVNVINNKTTVLIPAVTFVAAGTSDKVTISVRNGIDSTNGAGSMDIETSTGATFVVIERLNYA